MVLFQESALVFGAFGIVSAILASLYLVYGKPTRKRTVRFNPVIEGHKFERQESKKSVHIEAIAQQWLSSKDASVELEISPVSDDVDDNSVFLIRNVLTPKECEELIKASELTVFEQRKFSGNGDDSASCCFQSKSLSNDVIFSRIKNYLPSQSYFDADSSLTLKEAKYWSFNQTIECYGNLSCLNTSCRVERYKAKQHLKIHRDGTVKVPDTKDSFTVYAILIYLNDDYDGGNTRFCVDIDPNPSDGKYPYSFLDVKGKVGDALVFRHELLHKGGCVDQGTKYILRLDAAYSLLRQ